MFWKDLAVISKINMVYKMVEKRIQSKMISKNLHKICPRTNLPLEKIDIKMFMSTIFLVVLIWWALVEKLLEQFMLQNFSNFSRICSSWTIKINFLDHLNPQKPFSLQQAPKSLKNFWYSENLINCKPSISSGEKCSA